MKRLEFLLNNQRTIRVIGFDDAPFRRGSNNSVNIAGVVCARTRFEGMVWGEIEVDGWNATEVICRLLIGRKFLPQLHLILIDGIGLGGFNLIDLPLLSQQLSLPCVAVMRRLPNFSKIQAALKHLPLAEKRWEIMQRAGTVYQAPPFYFQVYGEDPQIIAQVLPILSDKGHVPEALRLAHLIGAAIVKGETSNQA